MSGGADVKSLEAVHNFRVAVINFQQEARLCLQALESQILKFLGWIERDRPGFWKREIELCYRQQGEARVSYHRCRMRKIGDFKPTCFEELKAMEAAKKALEFAQKQVPVVKYWMANANHEANEYKGRSSQLNQWIERDIPQLLALLAHSIDRLEEYANVAPVGSATMTLNQADPTETENEAEPTQDEESVDDVAADREPDTAETPAEQSGSNDDTTDQRPFPPDVSG